MSSPIPGHPASPLLPPALAHHAPHPLQVSAMVSLVEAYQGGAIRDFERILRTHRAAIMGDTFISQYMQDLLANIRTQVGRRWGWGGGGGGSQWLLGQRAGL